MTARAWWTLRRLSGGRGHYPALKALIDRMTVEEAREFTLLVRQLESEVESEAARRARQRIMQGRF
jgi:hypothetical protein